MRPIMLLEALRALAGNRVGVGVRSAAGLADVPELADLDPSTPERRRAEFALGRLAARDALAGLGAPAGPIPVGPGGEPVWPDGVVGSIGHAGGVAVAVAGWARELFGLGVDVEREARRLGAGALRRVCTPEERSWLDASTDPRRDALVVFGAKEAAYKALAGVGAARLRFHDLSFAVAAPGVLVSRVDVAGAPASITARHTAAQGFVGVAVQIPRADAPRDAPSLRSGADADPIDRIRGSLGRSTDPPPQNGTAEDR